MGKIFISYRRSDSRDFTGRLFDHLVAAFSRPVVFKDVDSLIVGKQFDKQLNEALDESDVVLVVIGAIWLEELRRRAKNPDELDFVQQEVAAALARPEMVIVPILIADTQFPAETSLPGSLRPLCWREGHRIHPDPHFTGDIGRLIARLRTACPVLPAQPVKEKPTATVAVAAPTTPSSEAYPPQAQDQHATRFAKQRRKTYGKLWEQLEEAHIKIRTESVDQPAFSALLQSVNTYIIRNSAYLETRDHELATRYLTQLMELRQLIIRAGEKEVERDWADTSLIPLSAFAQASRARVVLEMINSTREELLSRVKQALGG